MELNIISMDAAMIMGMIITLQIIGIQIMTMDHNTLKFTSISILRKNIQLVRRLREKLKSLLMIFSQR